MASVDDGLKIRLGLDTKDAESDISSLDLAMQHSIGNINRNLDDLQKNLNQVFSNLKDQYAQSLQENEEAAEAGENADRRQQNRQANEERTRRSTIEFERKKQEILRQQLEQQKRLVGSFRDMGVAIMGAVSAGASLRKALDFSENLTHTSLHLKALGMNATEYFETRNVLRKRGIEDGAYMGALNQQQTIYNALTTTGTGALSEDQRRALMFVSQRNPALIDPLRSHMSFAQWSRALHEGATAFKKDGGSAIPVTARDNVIQSLFGNNLDLTEAITQGISKKELMAEYGHAKKEADGLDSAGKITAGNQERHTINEANMAGLLGKAAGPAEKFFNAMNGFLDRYGEMGMMTKAVVDITVALGGWAGLKMIGRGGLWGARSLKNGGGKFFNQLKARVNSETVTEAVEAGAKEGKGNIYGMLAVGAASLAWNSAVNPETRRSNEVVQKKLDALSRYMKTDPVYTWWSGDYDFFTEHNRAKIKNEDLKRLSLDEIIKKYDLKPEKESFNQSLLHLILPTAKADVPSAYSFYPITGDQQGNTRKMLDILMREGGFSRAQATGIIASKIGESGLNPSAVGDHGTSFGIAQWHTRERKEAFRRLYGHDLQQGTLEEQTRFLIWEMNNTHKKAGDAIRRARTAEEATAADVAFYEKPKDRQGEIIRRIRHIADVNRVITQPMMMPKTDFAQLHWQNRASEMQRQVHNRTVNQQGGTTMQTMNNTIHIDARGGKVDRIRKAVQDAVRFPDVSVMNGVSGVG